MRVGLMILGQQPANTTTPTTNQRRIMDTPDTASDHARIPRLDPAERHAQTTAWTVLHSLSAPPPPPAASGSWLRRPTGLMPGPEDHARHQDPSEDRERAHQGAELLVLMGPVAAGGETQPLWTFHGVSPKRRHSARISASVMPFRLRLLMIN